MDELVAEIFCSSLIGRAARPSGGCGKKKLYAYLMTESWINYRSAAPSPTGPHLVPQGGSKKGGEVESRSIDRNRDRLDRNRGESYVLPGCSPEPHLLELKIHVSWRAPILSSVFRCLQLSLMDYCLGGSCGRSDTVTRGLEYGLYEPYGVV